MKYLAILPLVALAACATPQPGEPSSIDTPVLGEGGCDAETLGYLVGQPIGEVDTTTLPQPLRVIRPGMAVTLDYRMDRTNIELDDSDHIVRVYCG